MYPTIDKVKTGQKIKKLLRQRGISVKDVQDYLGLACVQGIYHWLDGRSLPTVDNLYALSELLVVPVDCLLVGNRSFSNDLKKHSYGLRLQAYQCAMLGVEAA
ncbi:MAG: helix-turn-helix transcriptional regulator [Eubacterium sp.]|nr:helix-turn-helix transcriptional regulator [Eubacterium sp.]